MSDRFAQHRVVEILELELVSLKKDIDHVREVLDTTTVVLAASDALLARNWARLDGIRRRRVAPG